MSGHSKWSTIKRKKGALDAKRGKIFTKLIRELQTAARIGGGDPDSNPRLRLIVDKAKQANMPKDNIERAIAKGAGGMEDDNFEEAVYEGYGPGGTAILIETLSDNKNRTVGDVRHVLSKNGGNLGASGCVAYLFEKKGMLVFDRSSVDADAVLEAALEAGADDVIEGEAAIEVVTGPTEFHAVREALAAAGFEPSSAELTMEPSTTVALAGKEAEQMLRLADALEDLDDVQNFYANFDIAEEELEKFAS
jgi:YebC/PmpR family DNA-binding regulatory protein